MTEKFLYPGKTLIPYQRNLRLSGAAMGESEAIELGQSRSETKVVLIMSFGLLFTIIWGSQVLTYVTMDLLIQ
jgi:hypothetical protein